MDQGGTWFFNEASKSLALQLVEEGFDVWVTNNRGTKMSNEHIRYTSEDAEYWNFTLYEFARYDLIANLEYIKEHTGFEQLIYIGHSMGTTQWLYGNTLNPDLHKSYKAFIALAPVAYANDVNTLYYTTVRVMKLADILMELGQGFSQANEISTYLLRLTGHFFPRTIWAFYSSLLGGNLHGPHIDFARLPIAAVNDMAGTSPKIIINMLQIQQSYPKQFDYGVQGNIEHYGMETPPKYELECLRERLAEVPILIVLGEVDPFTVQGNFERLMAVLPDEDLI